MTAADFLAARNAAILSLRDIDVRLATLFAKDHSNRVYAECLELLEKRTELADELVRLGGDPGSEPVMMQ